MRNLHLIYTDGMRTLSLFESATDRAIDFTGMSVQTTRFEGHDADYVRDGPTTLLAWHEQGLAFALVGDLDLKELTQIAVSVVPSGGFGCAEAFAFGPSARAAAASLLRARWDGRAWHFRFRPSPRSWTASRPRATSRSGRTSLRPARCVTRCRRGAARRARRRDAAGRSVPQSRSAGAQTRTPRASCAGPAPT